MTRFRSDVFKAVFPLMRILGPFTLIAVLASIYLAATEPHGVSALLLFLASIAGAILLVCAALATAVSFIFVEIGQEGIRRNIFGFRGKLRPWNAVTAIYKITYFNKIYEKNEFEFIITTNSDRPIFIGNLVRSKAALVTSINEFVEEHSIPSFAVDRSIKSRRAQFIAALGSGPDSIGLPMAGETAQRVSSF